jgi:hypothetical protein
MLRLLTTMVVIAWLTFLAAAYASLFLFPAPPNSRSQTPPPPDLSAVYLLLLAALLIPGIIRRLALIQRVRSRDGDR